MSNLVTPFENPSTSHFESVQDISVDQTDDIQTLEQQILGVEYRKPDN